MNIMPYRNTRDIFRLRDDIDTMIDRFFREPAVEEGLLSRRMPLSNIRETNDEVIVEAELPGMKKEDIHVTVQDNMLTIKGEQRREDERTEGRYHREERYFGNFERSFSLPASVADDKISANFKDGILKIVLPKQPASKGKAIEIK